MIFFGSVMGAVTLGRDGKETGKSHCIKMTVLNDNSKMGKHNNFIRGKVGLVKDTASYVNPQWVMISYWSAGRSSFRCWQGSLIGNFSAAFLENTALGRTEDLVPLLMLRVGRHARAIDVDGVEV